MEKTAAAAALPATSPANFQTRCRRLQRRRRRRRQNLPEDRISELPDVVIHDILARLQSHKQTWQAAVLSKRWTQLLSSYPILEFEEELYKPRELWQSLERFAKSRVENFSRQQGNIISLEAIRVKVLHCTKFYSELHDNILELAGRCSLREIDINFGYVLSCGYLNMILYSIPRSFFIPSQPNSKQFLRLTVLKLSCCNLFEYENLVETNNNPFSGLGSSLKELCLENVAFPDGGGWILNSMIAGASLLEKLTLNNIYGIVMIQIRNHGNIRVMEVTDMHHVKGFEITGAQSLERLSLIRSRVKISLTPNLKELYFEGRSWNAHRVTKLTADIPSLEILTLNGLDKFDRVRIVNRGNLRQVRTKNLGMCKIEFDVQGQCQVFRDGE